MRQELPTYENDNRNQERQEEIIREFINEAVREELRPIIETVNEHDETFMIDITATIAGVASVFIGSCLAFTAVKEIIRKKKKQNN